MIIVPRDSRTHAIVREVREKFYEERGIDATHVRKLIVEASNIQYGHEEAVMEFVVENVDNPLWDIFEGEEVQNKRRWLADNKVDIGEMSIPRVMAAIAIIKEVRFTLLIS